MGINTQIREFQQKLIQTINEEQLPLEIKRLVLSEIFNAVTKAADADIEKEKEEKEEVDE